MNAFHIKPLISFLTLFLPCIFTNVSAQIQVSDDTGQLITLKQPAQKVISLSPGLTELVYSAGGENVIKGVVSFSDFPEQAKSLPQIGSYNALDIERIVSLQPDLILAWQSGNPIHQLKQLKNLGLTVYFSEPREFTDIPETIIKLGKLMATEKVAEKNAYDFTQEINQLRQKYKIIDENNKKRTFIQIWDNPVMSINKEHLISKVVSLCGGSNIFAQAKSLTYSPDIESIFKSNPQIIIATGMAGTSNAWLKRWEKWPFLSAVKNKRLYAVNPDHLVRHTPRILSGIKEVCQIINDSP